MEQLLEKLLEAVEPDKADSKSTYPSRLKDQYGAYELTESAINAARYGKLSGSTCYSVI